MDLSYASILRIIVEAIGPKFFVDCKNWTARSKTLLPKLPFPFPMTNAVDQKAYCKEWARGEERAFIFYAEI